MPAGGESSPILVPGRKTIQLSLRGCTMSSTNIKKVSEIGLDLKEHHSQSKKIRIDQLKQEIIHAQEGNISMSEYFTRLKKLREEWEHICNCPNATIPKNLISINIRKLRRFINFYWV